jgi:hypothetical protein
LQRIEDRFAHEELDEAACAFGEWLAHLPAAWYPTAGDAVVREAACKLQQFGYARKEYVLLGLHTITEGLAE